jgi:hypothetical protein
VRHQALSVRHNINGETAPIALHLQGDPSRGGLRASATRRIPAQADSSTVPRPRPSGPRPSHERSGLASPTSRSCARTFTRATGRHPGGPVSPTSRLASIHKISSLHQARVRPPNQPMSTKVGEVHVNPCDAIAHSPAGVIAQRTASLLSRSGSRASQPSFAPVSVPCGCSACTP